MDAILTLAEAIQNQPRQVIMREREIEFRHDSEPKSLSTVRPMDSGGHPMTLYTREKIVEKGKEYTRETHPLLFAVVDWMEDNPQSHKLSVRKIADAFTNETGQSVSKSWAAVAKNYWQANGEDDE